jgi:uncharacterized damage-inducible protein DinB
VKLNELFSHWDQIHRDTIAVIEKFDETDLDVSAYEGGWTVAEIALHIANAEEGWFRVVASRKDTDWPPEYSVNDYPSKKAIITLLDHSHKETMDFLHSFSLEDLDTIVESKWGSFSMRFIIWHVIEHEIHHRGELSLIHGILGRKGLDV